MVKLAQIGFVLCLMTACGDAPDSATEPAATEPVAPAGTVAYTGATVWDGSGSAPLANATMVVRDGKIIRVDTSAPPAGAEVVNLAGRFLVPGFINAHGHASGRWADDGVEGIAARVTGDLELYARYGVTTVLSLGGMPADAFGVRDAQDSPALDRARLLLAGQLVLSQDAAEAAAMARDNIAAGVDWIKLRVDDNLGTGDKMNWEAIGSAMRVAAEANVPVAAHIFYMDDAATLLTMGVDLIAHSVRDREVSDEFVATLNNSGVCYVPTLVREVSTFVYAERPGFFDDSLFLRHAKQSEIDRVSDPEYMASVAARPSSAVYRQALRQAQDNLAILHDAGVPIAFGTDSGPAGRFPGYFGHLEFDLMSEAGLTAEEILLSATSVAARCLNLDIVGRLTPGMWADFVVLAENPLVDVSALHSLVDVYVAGNRVPD